MLNPILDVNRLSDLCFWVKTCENSHFFNAGAEIFNFFKNGRRDVVNEMAQMKVVACDSGFKLALPSR